MTMVRTEVRVGWKVYAQSAEVGEVENVDHGDLLVRRGRLIQHHYRVPAEYVVNAGEGVVDLELDPDSIERFTVRG
jgi:hypothetical protein